MVPQQGRLYQKSKRPRPGAIVSADDGGHTGDDGVWINPIGGLGDTLMISGVLKQAVERDPSRKFNLVVRTKYEPILRNHPAIARIGHPPPGATYTM